MKQSIQHKADASTCLRSLQGGLSAAVSPQQLRQAALAVMNAYSDSYSLYGVQAKLDLLQESTAGIAPLPLLSNAERQEVRVFCQFTRLLAEAAAILSRLPEYPENE
jgi:hypothetical protein